jgi:hypothetical protein
MSTLIDSLCFELNTCPWRLGGALQVPLNRERADKFVKDHVLYTTHLGKRSRNHAVYGDSITSASAVRQVAMESYLGITVQQYMYARHGIKLLHPRLPCLVVIGPYGKGKSFYPMELLSLAKPDDIKAGNDPYSKQTRNQISEFRRTGGELRGVLPRRPVMR